MIVTLTQPDIDRVLCAPKPNARVEYVDAHRSGLYLECRTTTPNEGTFYVRLKDRITGRSRHFRIGKSREISLAKAREKAQEIRIQVISGTSGPSSPPELLTYSQFMHRYYFPTKHAKRSLKKDHQLFKDRLEPEFGSRRLTEITRQQVHAFQLSLMNSHLQPSTQNHFLRLLRHSLYLALDLELIIKNPAAKLKLQEENNHIENFLKEKDLERLMLVLASHPNQRISAIIKFLLATGARVNEALKAHWSDIDLEHRLWKIPASNAKSKRVASVPLSDTAIQVLTQLPTYGQDTFVFINPKFGRHYANIHKPWTKIREQAGLPKVRLHDLRHTFASLLINQGRSLYEVQKILRHSDPKVTTRYSHLTTATLQSAVNSASEVIQRAQAPQCTSN